MRTIELKKFVDARGWSINDIYSSFRKSGHDPTNFQINYSVLYPGIVKAWHRHEKQDDFFCVLHGMAQVGVYNEDTGVASKIFVGDMNPQIVHIEAGEYHGLTPTGPQPVGLLYIVTNQYDEEKPDEERIGFEAFVGAEWWFPENK